MLIHNNTMTGFRQNHSTIRLHLTLKDDNIKAMARSGVTFSVMTDFSTAFNSIDNCLAIKNPQSFDFSMISLLLC